MPWISSSVTSYGRYILNKKGQIIVNEFNKSNGYVSDSEIVYGDTDSVMVNFGVSSVEEAIKYGKEASSLVSSIHLDFEKD